MRFKDAWSRISPNKSLTNNEFTVPGLPVCYVPTHAVFCLIALLLIYVVFKTPWQETFPKISERSEKVRKQRHHG